MHEKTKAVNSPIFIRMFALYFPIFFLFTRMIIPPTTIGSINTFTTWVVICATVGTSYPAGHFKGTFKV